MPPTTVLLEELVAFLATAGYGTAGVDIFADEMPPAPNHAIRIKDYPAGGPVNTFGGPAVETYRVQVIVRDPDPKIARQTAINVWYSLASIGNQPLSGVRYLEVSPVQSPFPLPNDTDDRARVACNYEVGRLGR